MSSVQGSVQSSVQSGLSNSVASSHVSSSSKMPRSLSPRRRSWFGRSAQSGSQKQRQTTSPKKQRRSQHYLGSVSESGNDELHKETEKLVRTLCTESSQKPLSAGTVQEAYLAAVDLQQEAKTLRDENKSPKELQEARNRVKQLHMELKAAQKAASQLASKNLVYEGQQEALARELDAARARIEELEKLQATWDEEESSETKTLREQLGNAKRALLDMQAENKELKKQNQQAKAMDDFSQQSNLDSVNDSFEIQLRLQKDLAKVMARVHRLEEENSQYAEKQNKMEEILHQVETLEQEKGKLFKENNSLKEQLAKSEAEKDRAVAAAKSAPSHKDMVLSSSQLATATTIIGRLTEECKTLTHREKELKEKLKRLETKNKNQKEIFQTALEIKQVEMKIYEQESKMNARKVEELKQTIDDLHCHQASIVPASLVPPSEDTEATAALRERVHEMEDRLGNAMSANQDLEDQVQLLEEEVNNRRIRVSQLEDLLEKEKTSHKLEVEKETAALSDQVRELSTLIRCKEDELQRIQEELEDERKESEYRTQVRVNELTEQLNDYEMSLEEREERIQELEAKLTEQEEQAAKSKSSPRSVVTYDDDEASEHSSKMDAIRRKMGTYENLMRAKMNRIQGIDHTSCRSENREPTSRTPTSASSSREESPPPMMVFATPVPDTRVVEMEASLKASDERIEELRTQLADAQLRLAQVQQAAEHASDERHEDMEASLKRSENRIKDLKEQLNQAHYRLSQVQQSREAEQKDYESKISLISNERDEGQTRLEEMRLAVQRSEEEVVRLRDVVEELESKLEEVQAEQNDLSRDESTASSAKDLTAMNALEEELEEFRLLYDDECDKNRTLEIELEKLDKERSKAANKLQEAEIQLLERQNNIEELMNELDDAKTALVKAEKEMHKKSSVPEDRITRVEAELREAKEQLKESDMKIEMLEQFIEEETSGVMGGSSNGNHVSSMQAEADIKRKDEEMTYLRDELERARKELLRSKERVENLEMERNYSMAKLKELSSIVNTKSGSEAEVQLYNKCIECAELSADKDDLSNKLRSSQAAIKHLEQEIATTKNMVNDISQSWDTAASADVNISRLKKEHGESVARAATLSIQLAESQMKIDQLADKLASAERANKAYAAELNGQPGILRAMTRSRSNSRHRSPERRDENPEMRRLKQRIALLEDQNAAYEASLSAFSSLHDNMQKAK